MRVGIISYPMLFQTLGGLQIQIKETAEALCSLGVEAQIFDPSRTHITEFDLLHVFSAINGNYRIVQHAAAFGMPVVVSPLIRSHWTRRLGTKARMLESLVGRLTGWLVHTEYREIETCLSSAQHLIALGSAEKRAIIEGFRIPAASISVVPNGIPDRFFVPDRNLFCARHRLAPGYVLNVATVDPHKNQLALAEALSGTGVELVVIGPCLDSYRSYLAELCSHSHVRYVGPLDYTDPALPSAYAAASVFCLPSHSEVMPLAILESLATGTPTVMTEHHGMDLSAVPQALAFVDPDDRNAIREAVLSMRNSAEAASCVSLARRYTWQTVAESLLGVYESVIATHGPVKSKGIQSGLVTG